MAITIRQFGEAAAATFDHKLKRSLMVLGPTGIGKSEVIHQLAEERKMKVIDVRLLLWALTDLKGVPYPDETHTFTKWLQNDVLPQIGRDGESGILLLEELVSAPRSVQAAAYQLTLDRKIGEYQLPDGWFILATGNREQDDGVYVRMPAPLADRFEIHEVETDFQDWKSHVILRGLNPAVVGYLSSDPNALYTFTPNSGKLVFATPRSWVAVADLLDCRLSGKALAAKCEANVGVDEATKFLEYYKNTKKLPNIEMVLNGGYAGVHFLESLDVYYLLIQNFVYAINNEEKQGNDIWRKYSDNSVEFLAGSDNFPLELKKSYVDQLCEAIEPAREYLFNGSRSQAMSRLLQELEYVK
ncbi:MAG: MoxR family ATPase [Candidatus Nomurabacteria bacterium]|jgi:hypothetical protein|nr:MoxR family ATPase [Candidatus Nomurabacteria bacterium]